MKENFIWKYAQLDFSGTAWRVFAPSKVIVLVHGIGEHVGRYNEMAQYFNQHNYDVIGIDHYGHGRSPGKKGASKGFEFAFNYLGAFIDYVQNSYNKPIILYGHSMGGGIVTGFILKRNSPIEAAIISSPALLTYKKIGYFQQKALAVLNYIIPHIRIEQGLDLQKSSHDPKSISAFESDPLNHSKMSIRLIYTMIKNGFWCLKYPQRLRVPTYLFHGDADEFTSVQGSRLFASKASSNLLTYREWPGGYHELHNEPNKNEVFDAILAWLASLK